MAGDRIDIQHKIIRGTGNKPTIPSPPTILPNDPNWRVDSDILIGQLAYNADDNKWYYRTIINTIIEFQAGGGGGGSVDTVNHVSPDVNKNVQLVQDDIGAGTTYTQYSKAEQLSVGTISDKVDKVPGSQLIVTNDYTRFRRNKRIIMMNLK